jgi:RNA polymerase sigma-70 factor, ECF subfamily
MDVTQDEAEIIKAGDVLTRARAGEAEAFCELIAPLQTRLLRQAVALSGDVSAAEDLVAETLVEAWKSLARYDETCRLSTWLYAILLHRHQKWRRRARARPVALAWLSWFEREEHLSRQENIPAPDLSPVENVLWSEQAAQIRECVERLPEKHREIILLRFFEEASLADMARVLGCPVGMVKSRLHHALEKLRQQKRTK